MMMMMMFIYGVYFWKQKAKYLCICLLFASLISFINGGDYVSKQCSAYIIYMVYSCSKSFQWTMINVRGAWFNVKQLSIPPSQHNVLVLISFRIKCNYP
jgi:hypothetical protein